MLVVFEMRYFTRHDLFSKNIYNIKTPGKSSRRVWKTQTSSRTETEQLSCNLLGIVGKTYLYLLFDL